MGFLITNLKTEKTLYRGVQACTHTQHNTNTERNKQNYKRFIIAYYTCDVIRRTDWEQRQS